MALPDGEPRSSLAGHELLPSIDVVGRTGEGCVGHEVNGERRDIGRSDHATDGECRAETIASRVEVIAEERSRQRCVDETGGDEVDADGSELEGEGSGEGRKCSGITDAIPRPIAGRRAPVPPMNSSAPPGLIFLTACRATSIASDMCSSRARRTSAKLDFDETPVGRPAGGDHHVIDRSGTSPKPLEGCRIGGVEGRGAQRVDLAGHLAQALGVPSREDQLGSLGACATCRLSPDAGAAANHDHSLAEQVRFHRRASLRPSLSREIDPPEVASHPTTAGPKQNNRLNDGVRSNQARKGTTA